MEKHASRTQVERAAGSAYLREFGLGVAGYSAILLLVIFVIDFESAGWWKYLAVLAPMAPALWAMAAVARHLGRIDEMHRGIQVSGMSVGFGAAMIAAMTIGFLAIAGLQLRYAGPWIIYGVGMLGWMIGAGRANSRMVDC